MTIWPPNCDGEKCERRDCELHYTLAPVKLYRDGEEIVLTGWCFRIPLTGPEADYEDALPEPRNYLD